MTYVAGHKGLIVWQKSLDLANKIYVISASFPKQERYGLAAQMRRAAVSIVSNIAEGSARRYRAEFVQFLYIARGSLAELETQASIASMQGFLGVDCEIEAELSEIGRLLTALIRRLNNIDAR